MKTVTRETMRKRLNGVVVAMVTPIHKDETPDVNGIKTVTRFLINNGISGLFILGSTGEFAAFDKKERMLIFETVKKEAGDKVVLIRGKEVKKAGFDAVAATCPYYYIYQGYEDKMVKTHFGNIIENIGLPTFLYDLPQITNNKVSLKSLEKLAKYPLFYGIKDSSKDFSHFQKRIHLFNKRFIFLQGDERQLGASILMGADGGILGVANVIPNLCVQLLNEAFKHNISRVRSLQKRVTYICDTLVHFASSPYAAWKSALEIKGLCKRYVSSPFLSVTDKRKREIMDWMKREKLC